MPMQEILAEVYRGKGIESVHFGSVVVVDNRGQVQYYAGDPDLVSFTRSSLKPFQAVPLTERGGLEKYGFDLKALAIMCGSHSGSPIHTEQVKKNLDKIGLDESYLQCGTHPPIYYTSKNILPRREETFTPIQHNCSGKHSGQLALALMLGCDPKRYLDPNYEPQKLVKQTVSEICEVSPDDMILGTDGCSLPNYAFPIRNLALGFANIGTLKTDSDIRKKAFQRIIEAIQTHPIMVSGEDRSDYYLMQALPKEIICKLGGEAIQGVAILNKGWGMAVKIADGNFRALGPVVVEALRQIGVLPDSRLDFVKRIIKPNVYNNRDLLVGHIVPAFKLKKG
ncbi:MAG TPA: asparaginase [candidate division Zixibacteria bacterium]|nr:asparaginase [candidate division Zixibacteria bacterium]